MRYREKQQIKKNLWSLVRVWAWLTVGATVAVAGLLVYVVTR